MTTNFASCFGGLLDLLESHAAYWRPAPFRVERPAWCDQHPALEQALRNLDDASVAALSADPVAAIDWLTPWIPALGELAGWSPLAPALPLLRYSPHLPVSPISPSSPRSASLAPSTPAALPMPSPAPDGEAQSLSAAAFAAYRNVPGRKAAQIDAFASAVGAPTAPIFEACAGKGHLARRMLAEHGGVAASLELDPRLCDAGARLAGRVGVAQTFVAGDIHDPAHDALYRGRHVVALHACGDLHRRVLTAAVGQGAAAIDLAPCCYQKTAAQTYSALSAGAAGERLNALGIDRHLLQLTVTETVTATPREAKIMARQQAWRLAFVAWRGDYRPFMPIPSTWWREGFAGFFHRLAAREGCRVPDAADLAAIEAAGWRRWELMQRLQLVRWAFRRTIELVLLLDMARWLETQGYGVRLREFCRRELTPRNVLLSARLL